MLKHLLVAAVCAMTAACASGQQGTAEVSTDDMLRALADQRAPHAYQPLYVARAY